MAKKRKTRKQKERLQQRKTTKQVVDTSAKADIKKPQATAKDTPVDSAQDRGKVVDEAHARRLRLMKYSLKVFAVLAVLQLVVWGLLQANLFPERILEILTG